MSQTHCWNLFLPNTNFHKHDGRRKSREEEGIVNTVVFSPKVGLFRNYPLVVLLFLIITSTFTPKANFVVAWGFDRLCFGKLYYKWGDSNYLVNYSSDSRSDYLV